MKAFIFCVLLMIIPFRVFSQEMLKMDIVPLADKIPAPPVDVKAAYLRLECIEVNMAQRCSADKFYQPTVDELAPVKQKLEQLNAALAMPASANMQNMTPEEMQQKIAAMTPEEQMQFAMQMSEQQMPKKMRLEPDEVIAAIEEHSQLAMQISTELQTPHETFQKRISLSQQRENKHQEINAWFSAEYEKLPQVSYDEAGRYPEPKAEYALKLAVLEKHIAADNEYLQALQQLWPEYREHLKAKYTPFEQKLAAANYGEDARNLVNKQILVGAQAMLIAPADELLSFSRDATETAAKWWLQKLELEQKKPQG